MPFLFLLGLAFVGLASAAPAPFVLDAMAGGHAAWSLPSPPGAPTVYLTFDDGPNPEATPALLDLLRDEQVAATFFVIDRHITPGTAPIVQRMFAEGHGVALHSHTRAWAFMTPNQLAATLTSSADRIEALAGHRPCRAFRPHAGFRSGQMFEGLRRIDYTLVGWGWNLWDWKGLGARNIEAVARRLGERASAGSILVMHDGHHKHPRSDRRHTVETVRRLVPALRARGLRFGTVCEGLELASPSVLREDRTRAGLGEGNHAIGLLHPTLFHAR